MKPEAGLLAILLLTALPAAGNALEEPAPLAERSEQVAEARALAGLDVENSRGRVLVSPSADGRIHVTATRIARMGNPSDARKYLALTTVESGVHDGRYVVKVHYPRRIETGFTLGDLFTVHGRHRLSLPKLEVLLEIAAPAGLPLDVRTVSGDVTAHGMAAPVHVSATSGDVDLRELKGATRAEAVSGAVALAGVSDARVRTTSGDITVHGAGALDCGSMSGAVNVADARGALELSTQSGDVDVDEAPAGIHAQSASGALSVGEARGVVRLTTVSGDIKAGLGGPLRAAELTSTSGSVWTDLAPGLGADLVASSTSGSIDCRARMTVTRRAAHSLEGRIGMGGPAIRIHTTSGELTVTSGGK